MSGDHGLADHSVPYDFSHLLDHTLHFGVEEAAVRESSDDDAPPDEAGRSGRAPTEDTPPTPDSPRTSVVCPKCGREGQTTDRFCQGCGGALPTGGPAPATAGGRPDGSPANSSATGALRMRIAQRGKDTSGATATVPPTPVATPAPWNPAPGHRPTTTAGPGADVRTAPPVGSGARSDDPSITQTYRDESAPAVTPPGVISSVPGGAPPTPQNASVPDVAASRPGGGTDDASTVGLDAMRTLRPGPEGATGPSVQAVHCPAGHPNRPQREDCRTCGVAIESRSITIVPRPVLGTITFDDGRTEPVDQPLVIGRKPEAEETTGSEPARAVAIDDPDKLLSRVHAELLVEDWQVLVLDRDSMNHTFVQIPGQPLFQLRPGEAFPVPDGSRIVFADVTGCLFRTEV